MCVCVCVCVCVCIVSYVYDKGASEGTSPLECKRRGFTSGASNVSKEAHTHTNTHTPVCVYEYIYMYVCMYIHIYRGEVLPELLKVFLLRREPTRFRRRRK